MVRKIKYFGRNVTKVYHRETESERREVKKKVISEDWTLETISNCTLNFGILFLFSFDLPPPSKELNH
jgi:hypothetical protein